MCVCVRCVYVLACVYVYVYVYSIIHLLKSCNSTNHCPHFSRQVGYTTTTFTFNYTDTKSILYFGKIVCVFVPFNFNKSETKQQYCGAKYICLSGLHLSLLTGGTAVCGHS